MNLSCYFLLIKKVLDLKKLIYQIVFKRNYLKENIKLSFQGHPALLFVIETCFNFSLFNTTNVS